MSDEGKLVRTELPEKAGVFRGMQTSTLYIATTLRSISATNELVVHIDCTLFLVE